MNQRNARWLILGVIGIAQLMVVLDLTIMNIALPSAQRALHFSIVDRQWVVTAYSLAFGSLLLLGGRLADLLGRKVTFLYGLVGFAGVSAIGGASVNFPMLVTARAFQGAFAATLVPSALSLLATTFTEPRDRSKAFGIYGAIAIAGGAVGLLLGGALTEYLSWRWTLYVNLIFAGVAFAGGALLLKRQPSPTRPKLDIPGVVLVSAAVFCLVYGCSNAATDSWGTPSTYGFLVAGGALLAVFALWQGRAAHPLLPPDVVLDRNRGGAYVSMFIAGAGLFGTFFFLTYYMQQTLGFSPLVTGVAFLPISAGSAVVSNLSTIVLMPRFGPKPLVGCGMLIAAGAMVWLARLGPHTGYADGLLGPLILVAIGMGMVIAPSFNTGTFGVAPQDAGVASATVTVGQQLGASVGTALLNTIFASAVTSYIAAHLASFGSNHQTVTGLALAHAYDTTFWWIAAIFAGGAIIGGAALRRGPFIRTGAPSQPRGEVTTAPAGPDQPSLVGFKSLDCPTVARRGPGQRPRKAAMKVAPGGATGFIGSHVLTELQKHGHEVTALVRGGAQADAVAACGGSPTVVDLHDRPAVANLLRQADAAIHTASPGDATAADMDSAAADAVTDAFSGTGKPSAATLPPRNGSIAADCRRRRSGGAGRPKPGNR